MKQRILELINQPDYQPLTTLKICSKLQTVDYPLVAKTLNELENEGIIFHNEQGLFGTLKQLNLFIGIIEVKEKCGFVKVEGIPDIYIGPNYLLNALSGDTVLVQMLYQSKLKDDGKVIRILKRHHQTLVGKLIKRSRDYTLDIMYSELYVKCIIKTQNIYKAVNGDYVRVIITDYNNGRLIYGKVDKILGHENTAFLDIKMLVASADIKTKFSSYALNECNSLDYTIFLNGRRDLRERFIVTIDSDDAKDFDDAIYVEKRSDDEYLLGVYIADVSEYVKVNSSLDQSAKERGFSCYLPNGVIPMLPFALSDDLCSLRENEDRYALAIEMIVKNGEVKDYDIFKAVINSKARLTYNIVNEWLINDTDLESYAMIKDAYELAQILESKRRKNGYLDFALNEADIILNEEGKCINILKRERKAAEKLIEEFMILANETIASIISHLDLPFIYRIHSAPTLEKSEELKLQLLPLGITIPQYKNNLTSLTFANLLASIDEDNKEIVNHLILKAMAKAKYDTNNIGHFGLATTSYTHFTSPIRRYPDLVVHRLIKQYLLHEQVYSDDELLTELERIANDTSNKERIIEQLERDVCDIKKAEYMSSFIHQTFIATISSIKTWGVYVELDNTVEGMISAKYLNYLGFFFDEDLKTWKKGPKCLTLMQKVRVRLMNANIEKGQIDFIYLGDADGNKEENHSTK